MISIIIPVYNTAPYLDRCIRSIVAQIYTDWECILIDDGSTDESGVLCDKWSETDVRIKVIHQENQGVSVARNYGIAVSQGEYIVFVDADDWVDNDYLNDLYNKKYNSDLAIGGHVEEYKNGSSQIIMPLNDGCFYLSDGYDDWVQINKNALLYGPHNKLFFARIIKQNSILFPINKVYGEDLLFVFQYLEHVKVISTIKNHSYHYIIQEYSLSKATRIDQFENDYELWRIRQSYMVKKGFWRNEMKQIMYKYLWRQLYDGIFISPKIGICKYEYLQKILSIPEIKELARYKNEISCSYWIKYAILYRMAFVFYLYFKSLKWTFQR